MTAYPGAEGRCGNSEPEEKSSSVEGREDSGLLRARGSRPRLCSTCSALVPVAADLGALGSFLISLLRDMRAANASPRRKPPCETGKIHFAPRAHAASRAHTTPCDGSDNR